MFRKLPKRNVIIGKDEFKGILSLLFSHEARQGKLIKEFEDRFSQHIDVKQAIAVSSGRFALYLILKNLGLKDGDEVLLSAFNFRGVPAALIKEGFKPVFVDADVNTYQIDIEKIEEKINNNSRAIIVTHLFGQPCDVDRILAIGRKYNLFVIEDAAHSLGSLYRGKHTGALADAGFFSFTGTKILNTSFGGMAVTNDVRLAGKIRNQLQCYDYPVTAEVLRQRIITYVYAFLTHRISYSLVEYPLTVLASLFNLDPLEIYKSLKRSEIAEKKMRFTNLQAFIGLDQMKRLDSFVAKRKKIADILFRNLRSSIFLQKVPDKCSPNYFMIPLKTNCKFRTFRRLLFRGIDSNLSYASDCSYLVENSPMPVAEYLSDTILNINLPFDLSEKEILYLSEVLNETLA